MERLKNILVIEDEKMLCETIISYLEEEGYRCEQAGTVEMGTEKVNLYEFVDIGLPDGNGLTLVRELKKCHPETGIIIISAKNSLDDKVHGLDLGADDYLTKPFHLSELNSRIKSLLRRRKFDGQKELMIDKIRILPENRQVFVADELLAITRKEFDLLLFFVSNQGRVLTKESIAEHLWGDFADSPIRLISSIRILKTFVVNYSKNQKPITSVTYMEPAISLNYK